MRTIEIFIPYFKYNSKQFLTQTFEQLQIGTVIDVSIPEKIRINKNVGIAFVKIKIINNEIGNNFIKKVKKNNTRIYYNNGNKNEFWDITKYISKEKRKKRIQKITNPIIFNKKEEVKQNIINNPIFYEYNDKNKINEEYELLEKEIFNLWS